MLNHACVTLTPVKPTCGTLTNIVQNHMWFCWFSCSFILHMFSFDLTSLSLSLSIYIYDIVFCLIFWNIITTIIPWTNSDFCVHKSLNLNMETNANQPFSSMFTKKKVKSGFQITIARQYAKVMNENIPGSWSTTTCTNEESKSSIEKCESVIFHPTITPFNLFFHDVHKPACSSWTCMSTPYLLKS